MVQGGEDIHSSGGGRPPDSQEGLPLCPTPCCKARTWLRQETSQVPHSLPLSVAFEPGCPRKTLGCLLNNLGLSFLLPKMGLLRGCAQVNLDIGWATSFGGELRANGRHVVKRVAVWGLTPARSFPSLASLPWKQALCYLWENEVGCHVVRQPEDRALGTATLFCLPLNPGCTGSCQGGSASHLVLHLLLRRAWVFPASSVLLHPGKLLQGSTKRIADPSMQQDMVSGLL